MIWPRSFQSLEMSVTNKLDQVFVAREKEGTASALLKEARLIRT
jgi:hypothetical protein